MVLNVFSIAGNTRCWRLVWRRKTLWAPGRQNRGSATWYQVPVLAAVKMPKFLSHMRTGRFHCGILIYQCLAARSSTRGTLNSYIDPMKQQRREKYASEQMFPHLHFTSKTGSSLRAFWKILTMQSWPSSICC